MQCDAACLLSRVVSDNHVHVLQGEGRIRPSTARNQHNEQCSRLWKQKTTARCSAELTYQTQLQHDKPK